MSDVKIVLTTSAELRAAQETKAILEQIAQRTDVADAAAEEYKNTLKALDEVIKNNQVGLAAKTAEMARTIQTAQSLGVNVDNLRKQYAEMAKQLAQPQQGEGIFANMRKDLQELTREVPALSRMIGKTAEMATGSMGVFAAAVGTAYEGIKKFAEQEVVWAKLDTALARSGHLMDGTREQYEKLIQSMVSSTPQTSEDQWGKIILRLTQFQRTSQQVQGDVQTIRNLAGVMGSVSSAAMAYERSMNGSFYMLRRYGIMIPEHVSQLEKMNTLTREAAEIGGGQLAAVQQTLIGQWDSMTTRVGELVEAIGSRLTPITDTLKFVFHELGGAAKFWTETIRKSVPVLDDMGTAVSHTTKSMGDMRQEMQEYQTAWKAVKTDIEQATKSLKEHDEQMEKSLKNREKFSKWQEDKDVAEIERTVADPAERMAKIALRKGQTVADTGKARDFLTGREIQEQQSVVLSNQRNISELDSNMQRMAADPNANPESLDNARRIYAQRRGEYAKLIIAASNKIAELTDKRRLDMVENQQAAWDVDNKAKKEGVTSAADEYKSQLQNKLVDQLNPDFLASNQGGMFLQNANRPQNLSGTDRVLGQAGGGQLDSFKTYLDANGGATAYRYLYARTQAAITANKLQQAAIELALAKSENNTKEEAAIQAKIEEIKFGAYNQYTQDIAHWVDGGRKGVEPIAPDANINSQGRVYGKSGYPQYVANPRLQGLLNQYSQSQFNRPTFNMPQQGFTPISEHSADFFPVPAGMYQAPPNFNPQTMVMLMSSNDGSVHFFSKNPDGSPNYNKVITESDLDAGRPTAGLPAPTHFDKDQFSATASFGGPGAGTGAGFESNGAPGGGHGSSGMNWEQRQEVNHPMITSAATIAAMLLGGKAMGALGGKAMGAGSRMISKGARWMGGQMGMKTAAQTIGEVAEDDGIAAGTALHTKMSDGFRRATDHYPSSMSVQAEISRGGKVVSAAESELPKWVGKEAIAPRGSMQYPWVPDKLSGAGRSAASSYAKFLQSKGYPADVAKEIGESVAMRGFTLHPNDPKMAEVLTQEVGKLAGGSIPENLAGFGKYSSLIHADSAAQASRGGLMSRLGKGLASSTGELARDFNPLSGFKAASRLGKFGRLGGLAGGVISSIGDASSTVSDIKEGNYGQAAGHAVETGLDVALNPFTPVGAVYQGGRVASDSILANKTSQHELGITKNAVGLDKMEFAAAAQDSMANDPQYASLTPQEKKAWRKMLARKPLSEDEQKLVDSASAEVKAVQSKTSKRDAYMYPNGKTEFSQQTHGSAAGRSEEILRDISAFVTNDNSHVDFTKMSKDTYGKISGAYQAVSGKTGNQEDLRGFMDTLHTSEGRSDSYQKLNAYYRKQGLPASDVQTISHEKDKPKPKVEKKKVDDLPNTIDGYIAENIKVLTTVTDKFSVATKMLVGLEKRLQSVESRP